MQIDLHKYREFVDAVTSKESKEKQMKTNENKGKLRKTKKNKEKLRKAKTN